VLGMLMERGRSARTISISQEAFIDSILARFNLTDAASVTTPLAPGTHLSADDSPTSKDEKDKKEMRWYGELVGALAWLAFGTRPDIAFAASSLAATTPRIATYTDTDRWGHRDDLRSIGAYLIRIGDGLVSRKSKKQSCVALLSTETEHRRNRYG